MKAIFQKNCEIWEMGACRNKDFKNLHEKKMKEGENFKLPNENKLRRLNKICSKCRHPLRIYEKECPVCGANDISKPIFNEERTHLIEVYFYNCSKCGRHLYSNEFFKFHE